MGERRFPISGSHRESKKNIILSRKRVGEGRNEEVLTPVTGIKCQVFGTCTYPEAARAVERPSRDPIFRYAIDVPFVIP